MRNFRAHQYKAFNGTTWVTNMTEREFREANGKGLVEHDENCWCNTVDDNPPFM